MTWQQVILTKILTNALNAYIPNEEEKYDEYDGFKFRVKNNILYVSMDQYPAEGGKITKEYSVKLEEVR